MDVDPKTTSESGVGGDRAENRDPLPPTESMAEDVLKGRYLLGPELGRGGFAITYVAADLELASRKVVVKVLNECRSGDSWSLKKFKSEMEALARIDHPNVVGVMDFGYRSNGKPFMVMQYIGGRSLREMIPREGLPLPQVAQIIEQAGRAVSAAHEAGVCHRDLKPENIMLQSGEGGEQVKVIDFGLATVRKSPDDSQSNSSVGTYAYMAPEQFEGRSSTASDIYQLGVLAYELVTGNVPFRASSPGGIVLQQIEGLKVPPKNLRPELPDIAQEAILKALSPDPRDRYERARDFGDARAAALVSADLEPGAWMKARSSSN
jgi:eukaryotic-like serine/threonine-protein kinase